MMKSENCLVMNPRLKRVLPRTLPVSYTHLDVYKRQIHEGTEKARVIGHMRSLSPKVQIDEEGYVAVPEN